MRTKAEFLQARKEWLEAEKISQQKYKELRNKPDEWLDIRPKPFKLYQNENEVIYAEVGTTRNEYDGREIETIYGSIKELAIHDQEERQEGEDFNQVLSRLITRMELKMYAVLNYRDHLKDLPLVEKFKFFIHK